MKLSVIALDYDGTITRDDRLGTPMIEAIAEAKRRGIAVHARHRPPPRRPASCRRQAHFVDVVVAENSALAHFRRECWT
jgi:hydroxymethylpyrimidine pyrophosphatase-like HAD family hydrolase